MKALPVLGLLALMPLLPVQAQSTVDVVRRGVTCRRDQLGTMHCTYKVGSDLEFSIDGVGESDAGITVMRTVGLAGDFYMTLGVAHGCVIVKPGKQGASTNPEGSGLPNLAFVAPRTGRVYESWPECQSANRRGDA